MRLDYDDWPRVLCMCVRAPRIESFTPLSRAALWPDERKLRVHAVNTKSKKTTVYYGAHEAAARHDLARELYGI